MDPQGFQQLGMGGILALLVLREVFGFLRSRSGAPSSDQLALSPCRLDEGDVARIHNISKVTNSEDEDGAKRVYFPKHVQRTLDMIAETQRQQTEILRSLRDGVEEVRRRS